MKRIKCQLIMNGQKTGYIFTPIDCSSIKEALDIAKDFGFPYRIFANGKQIKSGWFVK